MVGRLSESAVMGDEPGDLARTLVTQLAAQTAQLEAHATALRAQVAALAVVVDRQDEMDARLDAIELEAPQSRDWITLVGFAERYDVQIARDVHSMSRIGQKITDWHRQRHLEIKKTFSQVFGEVNLYAVKHLAEWFEAYGYRIGNAGKLAKDLRR